MRSWQGPRLLHSIVHQKAIDNFVRAFRRTINTRLISQVSPTVCSLIGLIPFRLQNPAPPDPSSRLPAPRLLLLWVLLPCRSSRHRENRGAGGAATAAAQPRSRVTNVSVRKKERRGGRGRRYPDSPRSRSHHRLYPRQHHFPTGTTMVREPEYVVTSGRPAATPEAARCTIGREPLGPESSQRPRRASALDRVHRCPSDETLHGQEGEVPSIWWLNLKLAKLAWLGWGFEDFHCTTFLVHCSPFPSANATIIDHNK